MASQSDMRLEEIGRCRLIKKLGEGGMGLVYRGRHLDLDIDVAVKLLASHLAAQEEMAQRFLREARLAARLNHPEIVRVYGCGEEQGYHYLVMEFVDGGSVQASLDDKGAIDTPLALSITRSVARALGAAQKDVGVIHRDIKPDNIMLTRDGKVKVADLGLAKMVDDKGSTAMGGRTATGVAMGTPHYMAPEQFMDAKTVDHRADIFSLGATLYHMLLGVRPFTGETLYAIMRKVVEVEPDPLPDTVPADVRAIVSKMVAKKAEDRYQEYAELVRDLEAAHPSDNLSSVLVKPPSAAPAGEVVYADLPKKTQMAGSVLQLQSQNAAPISVPAPPAQGTSPTIPQPPVGVKEGTSDTLPFYGSKEPQQRSLAVPIAASLGTIVALAIIGAIVWFVAFREKDEQKPELDPVVAVAGDPTGGGETKLDTLEDEAAVFYQVQSENLISGRCGEVASVIAATKGRYAATSLGGKIAKLETEAKKRLAEKDAAALVAKARRYRNEGALEKAMDTVVEALANVPDHTEAKRELAEIKAAMAEKEVKPGKDLAAKVAPLLAGARTLREAGLQERALEKLAAALQLDPGNADARVMVAQIKKDLEKKKATEDRRAQYRKWMDQGTTLRLSGKYQEAAQAFERAASFAPGASDEATRLVRDSKHDHHRARSRVLRGKGDLEGAIEHLLKSLEFKADPAASRELAEIRKEIERKRESDREKADADRWRARAEAAVKKGDLKAALGFYREARKHGAKVDAAIAMIEQRMAKDAALARAEQLVNEDKLDEAKAILEPHVRENPDDARAAELLERVAQETAPAPTLSLTLPRNNKIDLVYIEPGKFMMGSNGGNTDERPVHSVTISKGFYIGKYEVTKAQYFAIMASKVRRLRDPTNPADSVSWQDALMFCTRVSKMNGRRVRLPTEAEWEYACKAGTSNRYPTGNNPATLGQYAWFLQNSGRRTQPVGRKLPNAWGLHDILGNVCEWCSDAYDENYYKSSPPADPKGPAVGAHRSMRGGCAFVDANITTTTTRYHFGPRDRNHIVGLRVVAEVMPGDSK